MSARTNDVSVTQHLTFQIAGESYAIPLLAVREIIQYETAARVPCTPASIHGVINLRGLAIAVVDLAVRFGLPATVPTPATCILVVEAHGESEALVLGVLADAVCHVIELSDAAIQPAPSFGTRVSVDFLRGVGMLEGGLTLLLDIDRILLAEERVAVGVPPDGALADVARVVGPA